MMQAPLRPEVIEALQEFDSATVSNAIEAFNVRDHTEGYASMEVRCLFPELPPMVGYAVTCIADSTTPGPRRPGRQIEFLDLVAAAPNPSIIVIQTVGPAPLRTCLGGDMICLAYQRLGGAGLVIDGGIRDVRGIRRNAPGFQVFAPGVVVSHGTLVKLEVDVPVKIGGLDINPGDLLHGDESGLVNVPLDIAQSVAEQAKLVREEEAEVVELLHKPSLTIEEIKATFG